MDIKTILIESFKATPGLEDLDYDAPEEDFDQFTNHFGQAIAQMIKQARWEYPTNVEHPYHDHYVAEVETHNAAIDEVLESLGLEPEQPSITP